MALTQFSAPGLVNDFATPTQAGKWSSDVQDLFNQVIAAVTPCVGASNLQFASPLDVDTTGFEIVTISWPGFPNSLLAATGSKQQAYQVLDAAPPSARDRMDEYLEWYIHREGNEIVAIDFTTETEAYWESLFKMDRNLAAKKYSDVLHLNVVVADISRGNSYNPTNPFNTTKGIVHLIQGANTLGAELDIACQSTRSRTDDTGQETNDVVGCMRCNDTINPIGGSDRNSDPKIALNVSLKADEGRLITIPDPVGLYIDRLDTEGWVTPDGSNPQDCFNIVRGTPGVRARFEVPGRGFKISDIKIKGEPIHFAAQIAEFMFVKLSAALGPAGQFTNRPSLPCSAAAAVAAAPATQFALRRSVQRRG